jgi:hypothetical protein
VNNPHTGMYVRGYGDLHRYRLVQRHSRLHPHRPRDQLPVIHRHPLRHA